jgi:hypothetical protein
MHHEKIQKGNAFQKNDSRDEQQIMRVDAVDSVNEKQAEIGALKVIHGDQLLGNSETTAGQITGRKSDGKQGMAVPGNVQQKIEAAKGKGDALPEDAKRLAKGKTSWDLDEVRIHTDSNADELSKAVNAQAFTYGKDIYFGRGKFDTYTSEGKKLLAHELQHTGQKTGMIQRKPQNTIWGEFKDTYFEEINTGPTRGAGIDLLFTPNDLVDSTKIAMLQISKGYDVKDGQKEISYIDETERSQSIQQKDAKENKQLNDNEEGFQIDQEPENVSPLYAVNKAKPGQALKDAKIEKAGGGEGWNYTDKTGPHMKPAGLFDASDVPVNAGVTEIGANYEATALAVDGVQEGTYYGSVSWGWKWTKEKGVEKKELQKVSEGAVSTTFLKAAKMWNNSVTSNKEETIDLPKTAIFYETTETVDFYEGDTFSAEKKKSMTAPLRVAKKPYTPLVDNPTLCLVRILEGPTAGMCGWIDSGKLKEEDTTVNPYVKKP